MIFLKSQISYEPGLTQENVFTVYVNIEKGIITTATGPTSNFLY